MQRSMIRLIVILASLFVVLSASGKARTVMIRITGAEIAESLEITDPDIVGRFFVYTGPGVRVNGQQVHLEKEGQPGAFIDWRKGTVEHPSGLNQFEIGFFCESRGELLCYRATYEYDPACNQTGYIFLPGRGDDRYVLNTSTVYHGVEGNWFRSSPSWEKLVRPQIEKARTPPRSNPRTRFVSPI